MSIAQPILAPPPVAAPAVEKSSPAVEFRNLAVTYPGDVRALCDVNLRIDAGQHIAIVGASGSGKTTLLGCLSRRIQPTRGDVRCAGRIAVIHQDLRLVKQRSALENVLHGAMGRQPFWRTLIRFPAEERDRALRLLDRVGLSHRVHTRVSRLSGGEQQRVAIARALMQNPTILLADEPVASLDNANAKSIMRLLSELQRERMLTLISVLHDCELAETFADRILGFEAGRVIHDDVACDPPPGMPCQCVKHAPGSRPENRRPPTGLRGFDRFQPCRAMEALGETVNTDPEPARAAAGSHRPWWIAGIAVAVLLLYGWSVAGLGITARDTENVFGNLASFVGRLVPSSWAQVTGIGWLALGGSLVHTLQMALLGTTLAVLISWPLAALAANNVGPRWLRPITRFNLNGIRSVPSIVWALLFVAAVGLGSLAGVLALVAYSIGYLTKFYYEALEAVDPGPPDALREIGASGPQRFLHAVWPAGLPAILSSSLFMLEYNVRAASVLGIVGAGGIGHDLKLHIDYGNFHVVGAILLMLVAVVLVLDAISSRIRARLMRM